MTPFFVQILKTRTHPNLRGEETILYTYTVSYCSFQKKGFNEILLISYNSCLNCSKNTKYIRTIVCDVCRLLEHKTEHDTFAVFAVTNRSGSAWAYNIPFTFLASAWQWKIDW